MISVELDMNADTDILIVVTDDEGELVDFSDFKLILQVRAVKKGVNLLDELSTENGKLIVRNDGIVATFSADKTIKYMVGTNYFDLLAIATDGRKTRVCEGVIIANAEVTR